MINRLFKLLYIFSLVGIVGFLVISPLVNIDYDRIIETTYKVKCIENGQYVVLQGSKIGDVDLIQESFWKISRVDLTRQFNFYCKYYNEIQPHIVAYANSNSIAEKTEANKAYGEFWSDKYDTVNSFTKLFNLEIVSEEFRPWEMLGPIIGSIISTAILFILLQIVKISYVYVAFGEVVWHPLRSRKRPKPIDSK